MNYNNSLHVDKFKHVHNTYFISTCKLIGVIRFDVAKVTHII